MVKIKMNSRPVQKVGNENPMKANVVATLSKTEYCFTADSTPIGIAINKLSRKADPLTISVVGMRCLSRSLTGAFVRKE